MENGKGRFSAGAEVVLSPGDVHGKSGALVHVGGVCDFACPPARTPVCGWRTVAHIPRSKRIHRIRSLRSVDVLPSLLGGSLGDGMAGNENGEVEMVTPHTAGGRSGSLRSGRRALAVATRTECPFQGNRIVPPPECRPLPLALRHEPRNNQSRGFCRFV